MFRLSRGKALVDALFAENDVTIKGNLTVDGTYTGATSDSPSVAGSSGVAAGKTIAVGVNQSGTAGYTAYKIAVTETAIGSGVKRILQLLVGASEMFSVDDAGNAAFAGSITATNGLKRAVAAKTADYPMTVADSVILVGANSKVITLPSAVTAGAGRFFTVKNKNFTGTTVKSASGTIDDVAAATGDTASLASAYGTATYTSDGTNYWRTG